MKRADTWGKVLGRIIGQVLKLAMNLSTLATGVLIGLKFAGIIDMTWGETFIPLMAWGIAAASVFACLFILGLILYIPEAIHKWITR